MHAWRRSARIGTKALVAAAAAAAALVSAAPAHAAGLTAVVVAPQPNPIAPGTAVTARALLRNDASATSAPTTFKVSISRGVGATPAAGLGCSRYTPRTGNSVLTCSAPALAPGAAAEVAIAFTAGQPAAYSRLTYSVSVYGPTNTATRAFDVHLTGPADLSASVWLSPSTVIAGGSSIAHVAVADYGYTDATGYDIRVNLPPGATPGAITGPAGASCSATGGGVLCTGVTTAFGATAAITIALTAPPAAGTPVVGVVADPGGVVPEPDKTNNSASAVLTVVDRAASLRLSVSQPASVPAGSIVTRTITVTNAGNADAAGTILTDNFTMPTLIDPGPDCTPIYSWSGRPASRHFQGASCSLGTLAPGATRKLSLQLGVADSLAGVTLTDTASATTTSFIDPPTPPSLTSSMAVVRSATPQPMRVGTAPAISGDAVVGQTLTVTEGTWYGTPPATYATRWQRCSAAGTAATCQDIAGATGASYVVTPGDGGSRLRAVVTATNATGPTDAPSATTTVVIAAVAPANTALPTIGGLEKQPTYLWSATTGTWTGTPVIAYTYQWQRCSAAGTGCVDIAGATSSGYVLQDADVFQSVRVVVTATNTGGSRSAASATTGEVDPYG